MFGWFKKRALREQTNLIFQNNSAAQRYQIQYERTNNFEKVIILEAYEEENRRIAQLLNDGHTLSADDLEMLLDINRELRRLFDEVQGNSPENQVRRMMGQPVKATTFDDTFKPVLGWDNP